MRTFRLALLSLALAAPSAFAQSDEPIPYDDGPAPSDAAHPSDSAGPAYSPEPYSDPSPHVREETQVEQSDRSVSYARFDDPAKGYAAELLGGLLLQDSSRGASWDSRGAYGIRLTWEFGRMLADDTLHNGLFADLNWLHTSAKAGTTEVFDEVSDHYLTLAPGFELPFGEGSAFGAFAQVGVGVAFESTTFTVCGSDCGNPGQTPVGGIKPLFQYGIGLRGRPLLSQDGLTRLTFRLELTRFRRGYLNDTFLGASVGLGF
jgi:hypothetical protein